MSKIKILMVLGSLKYCNGITSYALNYYKGLDKDRFEIDFAVHRSIETDYTKQILNSGSKIFYMGDFNIKSLLGVKKRIKKLLKENHYDIIHCHILNIAYFYFSVAKKCNVKVRLLHSHATKNSDNYLKNIRNSIFKRLALKYSTHFWACSDLAGNYLFGNRNYKIIRNAIDYDKFYYSEETRNELLEQLKISKDTLILGFVGRFTNQKNIPFLIQISQALKEKLFNFKMVMIGDGDLKEAIEKEISKKELEDKIVILESRPDVNKYYSLFDIFLLPSFFEGLPVTGVEAQVSGCPCLFSDAITKELDFTGNCKFLSINSTNEWTEYISNFQKTRLQSIPLDFSLENETKVVENAYIELLN